MPRFSRDIEVNSSLGGAGERSETEGVTPTTPAKAGHST